MPNVDVLKTVNAGLDNHDFQLIGATVPRDQYIARVDLSKIALPTNVAKARTSDFKYFKLPLNLVNVNGEKFDVSISLTKKIYDSLAVIDDNFTLMVGQDPKNENWNTYEFLAQIEFPAIVTKPVTVDPFAKK